MTTETAQRDETPVLAIKDLRIQIAGLDVVDGVSLMAGKGRILAIVGESGCGKSLTALSILRLLPKAARIADGRIELEGTDLAHLSEKNLEDIRGNQASIIFQEPVASLNPLMRVGAQVEEALRLHRGLSHAEAQRRGDCNARERWHTRSAETGKAVSVRALRWHVPAGDDCSGTDLPSASAHR